MDKRKKKYSNNWNGQKKSENQQKESNDRVKSFQFNKSFYEDEKIEKQRISAIQEVKSRVVICPFCNQPITDIANAMSDKTSGNPVHFDCVLNQIKNTEPTGTNEKISYIGQGRFAVLYFENPRDQRHFTIKKIIEWESRDQKQQWRDEISGLYSKIN